MAVSATKLRGPDAKLVNVVHDELVLEAEAAVMEAMHKKAPTVRTAGRCVPKPVESPPKNYILTRGHRYVLPPADDGRRKTRFVRYYCVNDVVRPTTG